jgi:hypothetical protein
MTTVFLGGSRRVSRLAPAVRARLDTIIQKGFPVIVGDANGADKAMQNYLFDKGYDHVEVFCSGTTCRNNVGLWRTRQIETDPHERGFQFYAAKDRVMAREADFGLMIWDGKSTGTLLNVLRLLRHDKKVVLYNVPKANFSELKAAEDWRGFVASLDAGLRDEMEQKAHVEERTLSARNQAALLPMTPG